MSARTRSLFAVLVTLTAVLGGGAWQARTQPSAAASPPTTAPGNPLATLLPGLFPTTTRPPGAPAPAPGPGGTPPPGAKPAPGATSTTTTTRPLPPLSPAKVIPPSAQALIDSIHRGGTGGTADLLAAVRRLEDFGLSPLEAAMVGMGHFPVAGLANFGEDFLAPRFTPVFHLHQGCDVFAAYGTPVRAPFDGSLHYGSEPVGGHAAYVTTGDGTYYYMAHLSAFARGGGSVKQGEIVGYVGDSGNAAGGAPHVHFEVHPHGGGAVDPFPILNGWIKEALANIPALIASYGGRQPQVLSAAGQIRRFDASGGPFSAPSRPPVGSLLWMSSVSPAGNALRFAEMEVARAAGEIDWDSRATSQQAEAEEWRQADEEARTLLEPVTPPVLDRMLGPSG